MNTLLKAKTVFVFLILNVIFFIPLLLALFSLLIDFILHLIWNLKNQWDQESSYHLHSENSDLEVHQGQDQEVNEENLISFGNYLIGYEENK